MGRGALVFKGDAPKKKSKKSKHSKPRSGGRDVSDITTTATGSASVSSTKEQQQRQQQQSNTSTAIPILPPVVRPKKQQTPTPSQDQQPQATATPALAMKEGTGRITTSGTVVTGHGTHFDTEVHQGDALIVTNSQGQQEMRIVTMRLSATSCAMSSAFTENAKHPTSFHVIAKPRNKEQEQRMALHKRQQEQEEIKRSAFGTYGSSNDESELVYREKTEHGSYRIQRVKIGHGDGRHTNITRGDLLEMRSKKKADKYC